MIIYKFNFFHKDTIHFSKENQLHRRDDRLSKVYFGQCMSYTLNNKYNRENNQPADYSYYCRYKYLNGELK